MEDRNLRIPRRKRGAKFQSKESPFPIPIQTITGKEPGNDRWFYYKGYFRDNCVVVENLGDLTFLYKMGFFGKGFLSRSKPEYEVISNISQKAFSKSEKLRRLPPKEREIRQSKFRVIRKERFKNHQQWLKQAGGDLTDGIENSDIVNEKCVGDPEHEQPIVDEDVEQLVSVQEEEHAHHPSKRRKEFHGGAGEQDYTNEDRDRCSEHSSTGDSEEEVVSSRELDEFMQDVMRKSKTATAKYRDQGDVGASEEETKCTKQSRGSKSQDDPYKVFEHLQLSLEEAFFLSYGLGCLCVLDGEKKPMSLNEMWCAFCAARKGFIPNYITYHYFRSKGWVPKLGIKYGTDFVLYKDGMPFYHSSYSVIVQMVDSQTLEEEKINNSSPCRRLTWPQLCGVSRVNEHAAKEVMICYVIKPSGMTKTEMCSPKCIPRFTLQEVILRRWIPERAREPDKEET